MHIFGKEGRFGIHRELGVFLFNPNSSTWQDVSDPGWYIGPRISLWIRPMLRRIHGMSASQRMGRSPEQPWRIVPDNKQRTTWKRISALDRVTSCSLNPNKSSEMYLTTETNGLWHSMNVNTGNPEFTLETSYPSDNLSVCSMIPITQVNSGSQALGQA